MTDEREQHRQARSGAPPGQPAEKSTRSKRDLLVFHKGLILVLSPLLIQLLLIAALALVLLQLDRESLNETRYRRCAAIGAHLVALADQAGISVMAWFQSGSPELMKAYDHIVADVRSEEKQLVELTENDPLSRKPAGDLIESIDKLGEMLDNIATAAKKRQIFEMAAIIPNMDKQFKASKGIHIEHINAMTMAQEKIAEESAQRQNRLSARQRQIIIFGLLANAAVAALLLLYFKRSISDRLQVVRENTRRLAEERPLTPALSEQDEIGQLDLSFHRMDEELKEAIARERSLFDNASDVICVLDCQNSFERINPACAKHWGFSVAELESNSATQIVRPEDENKFSALLNSARLGPENSLFEFQLKKRDGSPIETRWSTYWSSQEELLFAVVHDISERKRIERMKQAYLQMISSDLKIPLASIAQAAETLAGPLASSLSQAALDRIGIVRKNLERLLLLVNDLLEMAALESGTLSLNKEVCQVRPLLEQSVHDLEGLAQQRKVRFIVECSAGECLMDRNRIMQVIVNLASNAVKFSPEGAEVELLASRQEDYLKVQIKDYGRGVPESQKAAIFEKFKQVEASDGKRQAGTGLGLPICKELVEEHGGEIGVESQPGRGSTFWFRLPIDQQALERAQDRRSQSAKVGFPLTPAHPLSQPQQNPPEQSNRLNLRPQGTQMSLSQKGFLLVALPLAVELIFILSILSIISQVNASRQEELRQRQIAANAYQILNSFVKMIVTVSPASRETFWLAFDECCAKEQEARKNMMRLLKNDRDAMRRFKQADRVCAKMDPQIAQIRQVMEINGYSNSLFDKYHPDRLVVIATCSAVSKRLLGLIDEVEKKQAISPLEQARLRKQQGLILAAGLGVNLLLSFMLARFFAKNISTRLATLADNTVRLSRNKALNPLLCGSDEIAQLDRAFHATADKLAESRRKQRAVFDNSHDLIAALDSRFCFRAVNPATEQLLGYSQDELLQKSVLELVAEEEREKVRQLFSRQSFEAKNSFEISVEQKNGSSIYLLWSLSRSNTDGNIYCVAHDISDRKQLEQLKQDFLAVVSHDLRNPLGSVIGFITLIKAGAMGKPAAQAEIYLDRIIAQADNLLSLINDLLDLEKLEAHGMQLLISRESAAKLAYLGFEPLSSRYRASSLQFGAVSGEKDLGKDEQLEIDEIELACDRERMTQAFTNIFSHILKRLADEKTPADLTIAIRRKGDRVLWQIGVPGPSYSKTEAEQLFERFIQAAGSTETSSRQPAGSSAALALPIARRIIESHGGNLSLNSSASGKQYFLVSMPLEASANQQSS